MARVLVACEYSGKVRQAFRNLGHDAWSCDILPADDGSQYHFTGDVTPLLDQEWDLLIGHPPCTYLTNAGVRWLNTIPGRWDQMREGAEFFNLLLNANVPRVAIENPIMHKYAVEIIGRRQDQVIQPWMFGHTEQKATCLWLKNLPPLVETNNVREQMKSMAKKDTQKVFYASPGKDRWKLRSETYQGIADAMANQWNEVL